MEKTDQTKMEQLEASGKQGKKPTKSKKSKEPEPLTEVQLEKLPKLPKDWKWVSHSEISIINPPKPTGDESLEISFLPMPAVEEETGRYSLSETRKLGEVRKGYTGFIEGDVIFAKITPCMENGKVALLEKLINGIGFGSTEFHVSRPTSSVSGKYLFHYLVQQMFRKEAKRSITGSAGQLRVSTNYFAEQPFPLAPLPEQRAIISKIELLFSELDNGIANLKLAQEQLKVYRQAVLNKAFEGELTREWREKNKEKIIDWKMIQLSEVADKITDGEHFRPPTQERGVYFLSAKDVREDKVDFSSPLFISEETAKKALQRCNPEKGDILIVSRGATVGRMCIVKTEKIFCLLGSVILIKVSKNLSSEYLTYVLKSPRINQKLISISGATAQQAIYLRDIKKVEIPLCSLPEQQAIVQEIDTRLSVCDKIEQDIEENLEKAEALRQSILKKAFEGKLLNERELAEVRGAEDWEPAEVLLERIRTERAKK